MRGRARGEVANTFPEGSAREKESPISDKPKEPLLLEQSWQIKEASALSASIGFSIELLVREEGALTIKEDMDVIWKHYSFFSMRAPHNGQTFVVDWMSLGKGVQAGPLG